MDKDILIYQARNGKIEFRGDLKKDTVWGNLNQIAELFNVQKPAISKHLYNIYKDKELNRKSTVSILETVQKEGKREVKRKIEYYNLDAILSIGYRVNSKQATQFRIWATKTLKQHLLEGYTINKKQLVKNYQKFQESLENIKALLPEGQSLPTKEAIDLISVFANTWFSLDAYDKASFPKKGWTQKQVSFTAKELNNSLDQLKQDLIAKKQANALFAQEKEKNSVSGIIGNIFQTFGGKDLYPSVEDKAAHLFYFMVKNHPFTDGNKRSGAFTFVWFLRKASRLPENLTPEALTALTLLVAESSPKDKEKMIGLILLLLQNNQSKIQKRRKS